MSKHYEVVVDGRTTGTPFERIRINDLERARVVYHTLRQHCDWSYRLRLLTVNETFEETAHS